MDIIKKTVALILFLTLILPTALYFVGGTSDGFTHDLCKTEARFFNICAHAEYTTKLSGAVYYLKDKDGKMLTDTEYTAIMPDSTDGWVGIKSKDGKSDYGFTVDITLNYRYTGISKFYARFSKRNDIKADMPLSVKFYYSDDGKSYIYGGEASTKTDTDVIIGSAVYEFSPKKKVDAKYIRLAVTNTGSRITLINEIGAAVYGDAVITGASEGEEFIGENGLVYRIGEKGGEVIGNGEYIYSSGEKKAIVPTEADIFKNGERFIIGKGSEAETEVINDFIDGKCATYSGVPNNIQYIVIHNTATVEESTDAERYNYVLHHSTQETSWHYTVDEKRIYHSLSDDIVGWHSSANINYQSIGIEICVCGAPMNNNKYVLTGAVYEKWVKTRFDVSMKRAAMLTAELLIRYGLTPDRVIQHYDATEKNCPLWMRAKGTKFVHDGTNWVTFKGYVDDYYKRLLSGRRSIDTEFSIIPTYILTAGSVLHPITAISYGAFDGANTRKIHIPQFVSELSEESFCGAESIGCFEIDGKNTDFHTDGKVIYAESGETIFNMDSEKEHPPTPKEGCKLDIRQYGTRYYIYFGKVAINTKTAAAEYGTSEYEAYRNGKKLTSEAELRTGDILYFGEVRLYPVLRGDANGDGKITAKDYAMAKRIYLDTYTPTKSQVVALALSDGKMIKTNDYIMLKRHVLGTYDINS